MSTSNVSVVEVIWVVALGIGALVRLLLLRLARGDERYQRDEDRQFGGQKAEVMKARSFVWDEAERSTVMLLLLSFGLVAMTQPPARPGPPSALSYFFTVVLILVATVNVASAIRTYFSRRALQAELARRKTLRRRVSDGKPVPATISELIDQAQKDKR